MIYLIIATIVGFIILYLESERFFNDGYLVAFSLKGNELKVGVAGKKITPMTTIATDVEFIITRSDTSVTYIDTDNNTKTVSFKIDKNGINMLTE